MNTDISSIRGLGPVAMDFFHRAGYRTIRDLYLYDADDRRLTETLERMKIDQPSHDDSYWKRVCTRCVNVITRSRNARALPFPPEHFICPITYEVKTNPFIAPSGITYEYDALIKLLEENGTDPYTNH
jgi:hypothetical protein